MTSPVLDVWRDAPDVSTARRAFAELLADHAVFASPVAEYGGRARAAHVLSLIAGVLHDVEPVRRWPGGDDTITWFSASVGGDGVEGVLREHHDGTRLGRITLLLRPYATLRTAIARMRVALAEDPLAAD